MRAAVLALRRRPRRRHPRAAGSSSRRARAVGVRSEYRRVPGGGHGYAASGFLTVEGEQTAFDPLLRFAKARLRRR